MSGRQKLLLPVVIVLFLQSDDFTIVIRWQEIKMGKLEGLYALA